MQVLFNESEESAYQRIRFVEGSVKLKIEDNYIDRIPNIGWRNNMLIEIPTVTTK